MNTFQKQSMVEGIPQRDVSAVDLALGVLTLNQAAAQLAFAFTGDPLTQLMRLICRGSLSAVQVAGEWRVKLEDLKSFLANGAANAAARKAMGVPPETVAPIFPWAGKWFDSTKWDYPIMNMIGGLVNQVSQQLPATVEEFVARAEKLRIDPRNPVDAQAEITPLMASLIRTPVPDSGGIFNMPDGSMFLNMGEVYLCKQLQNAAAKVMYFEANADPQNIKADGFGMFYGIENYRRILDAALGSNARGAVGISKMLPPVVRFGETSVMSLSVSDARIMTIASSSPARVAALAF